MPIRFACPRCDKTLKVDDRFAGRRAKCPSCRESIDIPETSQPRVRARVVGGGGSVAADEPSPSEAGADRVIPETSAIGVPSLPESPVAPQVGETANGTGPRETVDAPAVEPIEATAPPEEHASPAAGSVATPGPPPFEREAPAVEKLSPPTPPAAAPPEVELDGEFPSPFEVFDDEAEIVYAEGTDPEEAERFLVSRSRLAIPRAYVYLQGALLVVVALLAFAIGWAFGASGLGRATDAPRGPATLSGVLRVDGYDGPIDASEGALIAILPQDRKPAEKIPVDGLRPDEVSRVVPPRTLGAIREMGGALAVSDSRGEFQVELPSPGDYHVLVVLPDVYRPTTSDIALADLATLGHYFLLPDQLIGDCRYSLTTERVDESKSIAIRFP